MSQVLSALKRSEQAHQTQAQPQFYASAQSSQVTSTFSWSTAMFALCVPTLCSVAYFGAQYYKDYLSQSDWQPEVIQQVERVEASYTLTQVTPLQPLVAVPKKHMVAQANTESYSLLPSNDPVTKTFESRTLETKAPETKTPEIVAERPKANVNQAQQDDPLSNLDFSQLSPEIARRLQAAMSNQEESKQPISSSTSEVVRFEQNSNQYQGRLPAMNFQTHVYARAEDKRWVKINDVEYMQGDVLGSGAVLETIEPQACIIAFEGERLRIPALYDWKG
ncbi:GspB domain-containing protein [Vibrio astriarenae]|uniref:GspB domain-containing protein n=1 Tax=Vibrio astriarenae TaxID=1481923 RepID=A0A7Z2T1C2_9VIBR|nr:general secretion pathway protein GspB [Vibrio astriarenae]QIA62486.1 GspB domain-containing protein [Vibrio astriarenae]